MVRVSVSARPMTELGLELALVLGLGLVLW
jgi:hypothetical protein